MITPYELQFMQRLSTTVQLRHGFTTKVTTIAAPGETDGALKLRHLDEVVDVCAREQSK